MNKLVAGLVSIIIMAAMFMGQSTYQNPAIYNVAGFAGANIGAQISACISALPTFGGVCDARSIPHTGTIGTFTISRSGFTLYLPCGFFNVTGSIILQGAAGVSGVVIIGCGAGFGSVGGTTLFWQGNSTDPLLDLRGVRDSKFSNFAISSNSSLPLSEGIRLETWPSAVATRRIFDNILIFGNIADSLIKGMRWCTGFDCSNGSIIGNNDLDTMYNVIVANYTNCAFSIEGTQSKTHSFFSSSFAGQSYSQRGVCTTQGADPSTNAGSFRWFSAAGGGGNQVADFDLGAPTDDIVINGCNFESSQRLLQTGGPGSSVWGITINGCRWTSNAINSDGKAVIYKFRGALNITGLNIETGGSSIAPTISIESSGVPQIGNAMGNTIQSPGAVVTTNPFICGTFPSNLCWSLMGNLVQNPASAVSFIIPNTFVSNPMLVSSLPTCDSNIKGNRQFVTDQNTAVAYHGAVTGMGTTQQGVTCDGTAWYQD